MRKILLVEDEESIRTPLIDYLKRENFIVEIAVCAEEAKSKISKMPDLILLDWMLPDGQGIDLLKEWRSRGIHTPIIMLTARSEMFDKIVGLEIGANDYLTKPFEPRELIARIRVQLRQVEGDCSQAETLIFGPLQMNLVSRVLTYHNKPIELKKLEFDLLKLFIENPHKVFSRNEILNIVWGLNSFPSTRTVDNHILQLRQKINNTLFESVRGIGYKIKEIN